MSSAKYWPDLVEREEDNAKEALAKAKEMEKKRNLTYIKTNDTTWIGVSNERKDTDI